MPVPVYERQQSINPLPGARVQATGDANAYGASVGNAITNLAEGSMKLLNDYEDAQTLESYNNFRRDVNLYHHAPEKGVLNRQGKDTMGLFKDADLWMQNKAEEYAKKMKSPRMAANFRDMAGKTILSQGQSNAVYEGQQFRKYQESEAQSAIQLSIDDAIANWQDESAYLSARETALKALGTLSRGMGEEFWKSSVAEIDSKITIGRVAAMLEQDPIGARQWFSEHKNLILGSERTKVESAITNEIDRRNRQAESDERAALSEREREEQEAVTTRVWNEHYMDEQAALDAIYDDPDLSFQQKYKIVQLYQSRLNDQRRVNDREEKEWFDATRNQIANAGSLEKAMQAIEYSRADGWERAQLEGAANQLYKPGTFQEDIYLWHQAYKEVTSGAFATPEEMYHRWAGLLKDSTLKNFTRLFYGSSSSSGGAAGGKRSGKITYLNDGTAKYMENVLRLAGKKETDQEWALFSTLASEKIAEREAEKGHELNPLEKRTIIRDLAKEVTLVDGWITDVTMPQYQIETAKAMGFELNQQMKVYTRIGPDGKTEIYDSTAPYRLPALEPSKSQELPDLSRFRSGSPDSLPVPSTRSSGPRRMPDGREIGVRTVASGPRYQKAEPKEVPANTQAFIDEVQEGLLSVAAELDIPPSVLLAQAILESGSGKHRIGNNLFGVKAHKKWKGKTRTARTAAGNATFRDYDSVEDSIIDFGRVLSNPRYAKARGTNDYRVAAQAIQDGGYAGSETDYASKLIRIIEQYKLFELDEDSNGATTG
jgi:flagellum-specific peptidoglycan hydrolase FlgJ